MPDAFAGIPHLDRCPYPARARRGARATPSKSEEGEESRYWNAFFLNRNDEPDLDNQAPERKVTVQF